jgi:hypothetical protein
MQQALIPILSYFGDEHCASTRQSIGSNADSAAHADLCGMGVIQIDLACNPPGVPARHRVATSEPSDRGK